MKKIDILTEIANIDGWKITNENNEWLVIHPSGSKIPFWSFPDGEDVNASSIEEVCKLLPNYLVSYDAIIPVIKKLKDEKQWSSNPGDYPTWMFSGELLKMLGVRLYDNGSPLKSPFNLCQIILSATPLQLCEAVLSN